MAPQFMIECICCRANIEDCWDHLAFEGFCSKACKTLYEKKKREKVQEGQQSAIERGA
jgi:uncharacterized protein (UPF0335 family)